MNGKWNDDSLVVSTLTFLSGNLALSRALGDFSFKKNFSFPPEAQIITADPEVTVHDITEEDEFLVMACDGTALNFFRILLMYSQEFGIV